MIVSHKKSLRSYPELAVRLGHAAGGSVVTQEEWFDLAGNKIREITYSTQGKAEQENRFEYDAQGQLLSQKFHFIHEDLTEETRWQYSEGKLIGRSISFGFGEDEEFEYRYDGQGNLECIIRKAEGIASEEMQYLHSKLVAHRIFDEDGNMQSESRFTYDQDGRKTEEHYTDHQSGEQSITRFLHTEKPEPDFEVYDAAARLKEKHTKEYQGQNVIRVVHETFFPDPETLTTEFMYLPDGKQQGSKVTDAYDNLLLETRNEFNEQGFCIKEHRTENSPAYGTLSFSTHFEYTFFDSNHEK